MREALALVEGTERQDGLAPGLPPTHPRTLHAFGRERLARGFDDPGADGEVLHLRLRIAHAVTVAAKVSKRGRELSLARVGVSEMAERPDDLLDAIHLIAQKVAVLLELGLGPRARSPHTPHQRRPSGARRHDRNR